MLIKIKQDLQLPFYKENDLVYTASEENDESEPCCPYWKEKKQEDKIEVIEE